MFRHFALAAVTLAAAVFAASPGAATEWIGRWGAPTCTADGIIIGLSPKELDLSTFEATCRVKDVQREQGGYQLHANCGGEGGPMQVSFTVRVSGDTLTFVRQRGMEFSPKRYVRCR